MGLYSISHRLNVTPGVLEGFIGVEVETDRPVVVKRLAGPWHQVVPGALGATLATLTSSPIPGLTTMLEVGTSKDQLWLVQALIDAEPLRHVMGALAKQRGFISPNEGLAVVGRLGALLGTLHGRPDPVVHGDVCASNVLLTPAGDLLLSDAAVTLALGSAPVGPARAEPFTLAPEQLTQSPSPATDVFRLGLLLYELAVGHPLFFTADSTEALVQCQRYTGLTRDSVLQVPEPWRSLLVEMLAVEPIDRPTAGAVDEALRQGAARAGWGTPEVDISRLLERALPGRQPLLALAKGGAQILEVTPLSGSPPPSTARAPGDELEPKPSGRLSALPAIPSTAHPPMRSSVSPPPIRSSASPPPLQRAPLSPPPPTGAVVGRISTRKMSRSELAQARAEDAEERPATPAPATALTQDANAPRDAQLGALLVEKSLITRAQLDEAKQLVGAFGGTLDEALSSIGACDEDAIVVTLAGATKTPHLSARKMAELLAPAEALSRVSLELARRLDLVPLGLKGGTQLVVAMKDPMNLKAQETLKAETGLRSIVAMRAGENAIRQARNRFYHQDIEGTPEWPDRGAPPSQLPASLGVSCLSSSQQSPVVTGSLVPPVDTPAGEANLEGGAGRLVLAMLPMMGERGQTVLALASTAASLAGRLGASTPDAERVRFAAIALGVANLFDGRPPFEVPTVGGLSKVLGEHGWNSVEALVSPWLEWPSILPADPAAQAICLAFGFASHANTPRPRPSQLSGALTSFKARFELPQPLIEALVTELGGRE